jgi:beta-glucanase (GH16 family)
MFRCCLISVIALVAAGLRVTAAPVPDLPGWQLAWQDEFEGIAVDDEKWELIDLQNSHNNEKQYYKPEQASIVDGNLRITATNQPLANKLYRSARLESHQAFPMGRFEARIDLPTTQGMWPAFWLLPNGVQWPTRGEIDIMENRGSEPYVVSSAYHWQTNPGPCCDQHEFVFEEYGAIQEGERVNYHSGFHVYAVEWEATRIRFYVDGVLHYTVNETPTRPIFETPMNIILNLAVGGNFGGDPNGTTIFPQFMDVDYVRVWQPQSGLPSDYNNDELVDAGDYVVWRKTVGENGIGLDADGSGNGTIGPEDYQVWSAGFAEPDLPGAASLAALHMPEPAASVLMIVGLTLVYARRLERKSPARRSDALVGCINLIG